MLAGTLRKKIAEVFIFKYKKRKLADTIVVQRSVVNAFFFRTLLINV
jgi:hypothetical protein